ncbi:MAG TPA: SGNH/GDSL hydrolase family protein [Acidimicrobiales bacterium]|nr:SGNH/GDSL hydrolase family protein [Acidimicrobiales bacterium]
MRGWAAALAAAAAAAVLALAACSPGGDRAEAPDAAPDDPPATYVAIGSDDTLGIGLDLPLVDEWPKVLFRENLPRNTVFVNAAVQGATVADALVDQLPLAEEVEPTLVTVWLNLDDVTAGTPVPAYERRLRDLVHALRRGGETRVLVANTPEMNGEAPATVAAYNAAIARVARAEGADLVDLHGAGLSAPSRDHPSPEGHERIAEAFAAVL